MALNFFVGFLPNLNVTPLLEQQYKSLIVAKGNYSKQDTTYAYLYFDNSKANGPIKKQVSFVTEKYILFYSRNKNIAKKIN